VRLHLPHLFADICFQIIERVEVGGFARDGAHFVGEFRAELVFVDLQQSAICVVDDDEFLRVKQVMGNNQRADRVVGRDASGVADHVSVAGTKAEAMLEQDAGIHACKYGGVTARPNLQVAQVEAARENLVGG